MQPRVASLEGISYAHKDSDSFSDPGLSRGAEKELWTRARSEQGGLRVDGWSSKFEEIDSRPGVVRSS